MTIRFDGAWSSALAIGDQMRRTGADIIVLRDLIGRVSFIVANTRSRPLDFEGSADYLDKLGAFAAPTPIIYSDDLFDRDSILQAADLVVKEAGSDGEGSLSTLERTIVGSDWVRPEEPGRTRRVTLYGFKGGVGRSTATFMLAQHLARQGSCVLVADLDLESPGVGALLQRQEDLPDYGLIDHLVEASVGNAAGLDLVTRSETAPASGNGEVWVAPASGRPRDGYDYLSKLNRVYLDSPTGEHRFGERIDAALVACEQRVSELSRTPDVVLLDSRAGIHDIAAVAITQLSELSLLFAGDNPQTWSGYRLLFSQWQQNLSLEKLDQVRQRLRMVASMVQPNEADRYIERFQDHSQECFAETLYDAVGPDDPDDLNAFNFQPRDSSAPHSPLPILFSSDLVGLDPVDRPDWYARPLISAAYERFLSAAADLIGGGSDGA
ncbi:ParA family protein [Kribbella sp. GL6]|uniref:ParA family protein n=1 Tax=Kribbella sp. GL6 TaxID=3419765 RepID=UPI003D06A800